MNKDCKHKIQYVYKNKTDKCKFCPKCEIIECLKCCKANSTSKCKISGYNNRGDLLLYVTCFLCNTTYYRDEGWYGLGPFDKESYFRYSK